MSGTKAGRKTKPRKQRVEGKLDPESSSTAWVLGIDEKRFLLLLQLGFGWTWGSFPLYFEAMVSKRERAWLMKGVETPVSEKVHLWAVVAEADLLSVLLPVVAALGEWQAQVGHGQHP